MRSFSVRIAVLVSLATIYWFASTNLQSPLVNVAHVFFETAQADKIDNTLRLFSNQAKEPITNSDLQAFVTRHQLNRYKSFNWNDQSIKEKAGKLTGILQTQEGKQIPLEFIFEKNQKQQWKIIQIRILNSIKDSILEDFPKTRAAVRQ